MSFDTSRHGKYKFTQRQADDIRDFNTMFTMDIADRCEFPKPRKIWAVRKLF